MATSMAELMAWIMFMRAMSVLPAELAERQHLLALHDQASRHFLEHVLEHRARVVRRRFAEGAVAGGFLELRLHVLGELGHQRVVALLVPFLGGDEVLLEALDRIAERPVLPFVGRAIGGGIVAG